VTSFFSQNSRQHYREGNLTISPYSSKTQDASFKQALHKMLCPMALSQGSLYEVPRRLHRRYVVMLK